MESEKLQGHAELPVGQPLAPKLKENAKVLCERKMLVSEKLCISKVKYIHAQPLIPHPPKIELQCSTSISLYFWSMLSENYAIKGQFYKKRVTLHGHFPIIPL